MAEFHVPKRHLFAVLNEAVLHERTHSSVFAPLFDVKLMDLDLTSWRMHNIARQRDFKSLPKLDEHLQREVPCPTDLRTCLITSCAIDYAHPRKVRTPFCGWLWLNASLRRLASSGLTDESFLPTWFVGPVR